MDDSDVFAQKGLKHSTKKDHHSFCERVLRHTSGLITIWSGSEAHEYHSPATKAAKGRRTGALSGDCSRDSFKAATTSRDPFSRNAGRTWVPRPLHGAAKTLYVRAEGSQARSPPPRAARAPPPSQTPAATPPLPETSLLSKGGGKPWAFRSDWSPPAARGEAAIGCRALSVAEARAFAGEAQPGLGAPAAAAAARAGAAGRARAGAAAAAAASAAAHPAAPPALPVLQAAAGEGRPREQSTRRRRRRRSDAGTGDPGSGSGAAASPGPRLQRPCGPRASQAAGDLAPLGILQLANKQQLLLAQATVLIRQAETMLCALHL
ncbi:transcription initiation factor TFIID subunit 4-like [Neofelis nebulosa]|uniref:transcription initiation factor TFIID subunit 4-like n=1 Tax=Neofelis nebulosa TaxID=61452 RepID=UPI00272AD130|nr:transcription initiation factor TFIID subunit 4-like [Neofelis nebulosa]